MSESPTPTASGLKPIYRVVETGEIGQLIPRPCDNPIILEIKDGIRDVYFLRKLEPTTHPITDSYPTRGNATKNGVKGRPKGMERGTEEKMLQIYRLLETQSEQVNRAAIEKALVNCTRPLTNQPSQAKQVTLESLGIAEQIPEERTWVARQLTELERTEGVDIIRRLLWEGRR